MKFESQEEEAQSKYINPNFNIVNCSDSTVGSAGTGRLSVWNMQTNVDEYSSSPQYKQAKEREDESSEQDSDSDEEDAMDVEVDCAHESNNIGMESRLLQVEQDGFACGDLLIAPI